MKLEEIRQDLFEMANLTRDETGLDRTIWVSVKSHSVGPRIKVNFDNSLRFNEGNNFSVSISHNPNVVAGGTEEQIIRKIGSKKLDDVYDWIILNETALLEYWNCEISTKVLFAKLKEI